MTSTIRVQITCDHCGDHEVRGTTLSPQPDLGTSAEENYARNARDLAAATDAATRNAGWSSWVGMDGETYHQCNRCEA